IILTSLLLSQELRVVRRRIRPPSGAVRRPRSSAAGTAARGCRLREAARPPRSPPGSRPVHGIGPLGSRRRLPAPPRPGRCPGLVWPPVRRAGLAPFPVLSRTKLRTRLHQAPRNDLRGFLPVLGSSEPEV